MLKESRADIVNRPWFRESARKAQTQYFKLKQAREEQDRLDIEATRLYTWIHDETKVFALSLAQEEARNPLLAHQIRCLAIY